MKFFITLILFLYSIKAFANVPTPDFTVSATQSCPYQDVTISNTSTITNNIISYVWTFEKGVPSSFTGQNPPLVQWEKEGEFEIKLEIIYDCSKADVGDPQTRVGNIGGEGVTNCTTSVSLSKSIIIDARCCPNLPLYNQSMLDNGIIINKVFLVTEDLIVTSGNSLEINDGSLLMAGESLITPGVPGGTVTSSPYIYGRTGSLISMRDGQIKAYCESMWPGIEFEQDAFIEFQDSRFEDAYHGIHLELKVGGVGDFSYGFEFKNVVFKNNYKSVTISENIYSTSFIRNCLFVGDSLTMRSPFNHDEAHNFGEFFKPYYGYGQNTLASIDRENNKWNTYKNLIYGIRHTVAYDEGLLETSECHFINNSIAAIYAAGSENLYFEGTQMRIPARPFVGYQMLNEPFFVNNETIYGFFFDIISCSPELNNGEIRTMAYDLDELFQADYQRKAIEAPALDDFDLIVNLYTIKNMHWGIESGLKNTEVTNTILDNCITGIYLDNLNNATGGHSLVANCNHFKQPISHSFNRYGIFLEDGSQLNPVGGDGTVAPNFTGPNGNGFPADPNNSIGFDPDPYAACFGNNCAGNVGDWQVPSAWFSIWDNNATTNASNPSFQYYRYENEFMGDINNQSSSLGVYPGISTTPLVVDALIEAHMYSPIQTNPPATCSNVQSIPFPPLPRISGEEDYDRNSRLVFPNPINGNTIFIQSESNLKEVNISAINGKSFNSTIQKTSDENFKISINTDIPNGLYLIQVTNAKDQVKQYKIMKE